MPKKQNNDDLIEEAGQGHNSFSASDLRRLLEELESLHEIKKNASEDIKAAMDIAAQKGFDKRTVREMLKMRALDSEVRKEREDLRDLYLAALDLI